MQEEDNGDRYGNFESSCQGNYMEGPEERKWDVDEIGLQLAGSCQED